MINHFPRAEPFNICLQLQNLVLRGSYVFASFNYLLTTLFTISAHLYHCLYVSVAIGNMASLSLTSSPSATRSGKAGTARVCATRAELIPPTSTSGRCRFGTPYSSRHLSTHHVSSFSASRSIPCARSHGCRSRKERYTRQACAASSVESPEVTGDLSGVPQPVLVVGATGGVGICRDSSASRHVSFFLKSPEMHQSAAIFTRF